MFKLAVAGAPSDIATELTTGWWETNDEGCNCAWGAGDLEHAAQAGQGATCQNP